MYRRKYHAESTNVSIVSVSLLAQQSGLEAELREMVEGLVPTYMHGTLLTGHTTLS